MKPPALEGVAGLSLVERLRMLPDPRRRRGVRHPFVAVLLVAASAVVAGARSYAAIGQWSAAAPQHALARLGARVAGVLGVRVAPSAATVRRVIGLVCPGGLADLTGADPGGTKSLAVDGKVTRGSRHGQTPAAHLLAAMTGDGQTVTQLRVPGKTNEITCFTALLEPYDLTGVTVTAEAAPPPATSDRRLATTAVRNCAQSAAAGSTLQYPAIGVHPLAVRRILKLWLGSTKGPSHAAAFPRHHVRRR
ncbi:transposase family protein [Streptomyces sp. NPDC058000]|uniref:transposase family protein n=1 Tax=Streptomyces sp. NPDC058000 TaxID=3346299 RepID=UPI0036E64292